MTEAEFLGALPTYAFALVLLIARAGGVCMLIPAIGEAEVPATIRAGFTLALAALLLPGLGAHLPGAPVSPWRAAGMVGAEIVTGLWLGWSSRLLMLALSFAGQIAALAVGLASVIQPDPALGTQNAALGRLLGLAATVMLLATGLYRLPLASLAGSYDVIGAGALLPSDDAARGIVGAVGAMTALAIRLAGPFLLASVLGQATLALLARLVPNLQVFALAAPLQVLAGFVLLGLLATIVLASWRDQAASALAALPGL